MLKITIPARKDCWDDKTQRFLPDRKEYVLQLEHSLLSISKWEALYHKPFLSTKLTLEMIQDYARCMTLNPNVPEDVYDGLSPKNIDEITDYILDSKTATWFTESDGTKTGSHSRGKMNGKVITSELLYCWMTQMNIPFSCEKWHLNRLITLIRVVSIENDPDKNKGKKMTAAERKALNKARQAKYHTRG